MDIFIVVELKIARFPSSLLRIITFTAACFFHFAALFQASFSFFPNSLTSFWYLCDRCAFRVISILNESFSTFIASSMTPSESVSSSLVVALSSPPSLSLSFSSLSFNKSCANASALCVFVDVASNNINFFAARFCKVHPEEEDEMKDTDDDTSDDDDDDDEK